MSKKASYPSSKGRIMAEPNDPRVVRTRTDVAKAALDILLSEGWTGLTHGRVAKHSGYSRATIYTHWPTQMDLARDAFAAYEEMPHFLPTGDLRADLTGEVQSFVDAMVDYHLDRGLSMLAEKAQTSAEVSEIRDRFVAAGEGPMRQTLDAVEKSEFREAATLMLCGMVTHSVLMHGRAPDSSVLSSAVDLVISGAKLES